MDSDSLARALFQWLATLVAAPTGAFALVPLIALASEVKTMDLSFFFQWMQDGDVWEWLRVLLAALLGALVGGFFTLSGQKREAKAQSKREARAQSIADLRALFESFVNLGQDIDDAPRTMGHILGSPWRKEWRSIWTRQRQNAFRSQAELIPDERLRGHIVSIVKYLGRAPDMSREGRIESNVPLRMLVEKLAEAGMTAMAATVRGEAYDYRKTDSFMGRLKTWSDSLDDWEEHSIASSEAAEEAHAATASPEARARAEAIVTAIIRAEQDADLEEEHIAAQDADTDSGDEGSNGS